MQRLISGAQRFGEDSTRFPWRRLRNMGVRASSATSEEAILQARAADARRTVNSFTVYSHAAAGARSQRAALSRAKVLAVRGSRGGSVTGKSNMTTPKSVGHDGRKMVLWLRAVASHAAAFPQPSVPRLRQSRCACSAQQCCTMYLSRVLSPGADRVWIRIRVARRLGRGSGRVV